MKKELKLLLLILILPLILCSCELHLNYYEDKLYSEKNLITLNKNNKLDSTNVFTREKAITKAITVFNKGLGVNIDRNKFSEFIQLSKNEIPPDFTEYILKWQITWIDPDSKINYHCEIACNNGEILNIEYSSNERNYEKIDKEPNLKELIGIANPLFSQLKIDINDYKLNDHGFTTVFKYGDYNKYYLLSFNNRYDYNKSFFILINYKNKKIISFKKGIDTK
ncbi:hypothetical protein [Haloimpatiens massiliensis]|uniref:hypothetical protein n=1 Tax=Haloimpatiens massiliensis TaxID=1658110 RepID=UPI000C830F9B|nr:hypothetical protein [Haloimpatiens massiliensis]